MKSSHRDNTVGPWAKQKLDGLEAYLRAYMEAMKNQTFTLVYVDAFAGAGVSKLRGYSEPDDFQLIEDDRLDESEEEFIGGSPLRSAGLPRIFNKYFFFDADESRAATLSEIKARTEIDAFIKVGDGNKYVQNLAPKLARKNVRGVAFLDPYGPHLEWETIQSLGHANTMEVIINFPLGMAINRLITKDGNVPQKWADLLDRCFGTTAWRDVSYQSQPNLFGDLEIIKRDNAGAALLGLYIERLRSVFTYVSQPSVVRNTRGFPIYYMIWAGQNRTGFKIAEHILGLGEKVTVPR